jgi:hypothetical protein
LESEGWAGEDGFKALLNLAIRGSTSASCPSAAVERHPLLASAADKDKDEDKDEDEEGEGLLLAPAPRPWP